MFSICSSIGLFHWHDPEWKQDKKTVKANNFMNETEFWLAFKFYYFCIQIRYNCRANHPQSWKSSLLKTFLRQLSCYHVELMAT